MEDPLQTLVVPGDQRLGYGVVSTVAEGGLESCDGQRDAFPASIRLPPDLYLVALGGSASCPCTDAPLPPTLACHVGYSAVPISLRYGRGSNIGSGG